MGCSPGYEGVIVKDEALRCSIPVPNEKKGNEFRPCVPSAIAVSPKQVIIANDSHDSSNLNSLFQTVDREQFNSSSEVLSKSDLKMKDMSRVTVEDFSVHFSQADQERYVLGVTSMRTAQAHDNFLIYWRVSPGQQSPTIQKVSLLKGLRSKLFELLGVSKTEGYFLIEGMASVPNYGLLLSIGAMGNSSTELIEKLILVRVPMQIRKGKLFLLHEQASLYFPDSKVLDQWFQRPVHFSRLEYDPDSDEIYILIAHSHDNDGKVNRGEYLFSLSRSRLQKNLLPTLVRHGVSQGATDAQYSRSPFYFSGIVEGLSVIGPRQLMIVKRGSFQAYGRETKVERLSEPYQYLEIQLEK